MTEFLCYRRWWGGGGRHAAGVDPADAERMTAFWGDDSWREVVYRPARQVGFDFAGAEVEKAANAEVAEAFRQRLHEKAGFKRVPEPMPMRNSTGAVVYYLYFASQKDVAEKVAVGIFARHRGRGC
ncbi:MAG: hypothetical protein HY905_26645 [Deltaproteobacteria bacterium]|nr:hypothetical protein [Deltaproteobacteria bacterium]